MAPLEPSGRWDQLQWPGGKGTVQSQVEKRFQGMLSAGSGMETSRLGAARRWSGARYPGYTKSGHASSLYSLIHVKQDTFPFE